MIFLVDHNLAGHAEISLGTIVSQGWLEPLPIRFVTFKEVHLPIDSSDRIVGSIAQANQMILLTANRSMKGKDSLEQVFREEDTMSLTTLWSSRAFTISPDRALNRR